MKNPIPYIAIVLMLAVIACVERIDLDRFGDTDLLVVEAEITDQQEFQEVKLSTTASLTAESAFMGLRGAEVWLTNLSGDRFDFFEQERGIYRSEMAFGAELGQQYQLHIELSGGQSYESAVVEMIPTSPIDSLYAEFTPLDDLFNPGNGDFDFYADTRQNSEENRFFKWEWNATYEVVVPTPSRYIWLGGNDFLIRERGSANDSLQEEICWKNERSTTILVEELLLGETEISRLPLISFNTLGDPRMKIRYSIELKQYALRQESYEYWNLIRESNGGGGFLFDTQVGTITGNIVNTNNSSETVLGYFDVLQEQSVREFFTPADFRKLGFVAVDRFVVDCSNFDLELTAVDEIGEFMESNGEAYNLCYFQTTPPAAVFCLKECSECTRYSDTNKRPDFW